MQYIRLNNVDLDLLKKQKISLLRTISRLEGFKPKNELQKATISDLDGILNLLDHITDADIENRIIDCKCRDFTITQERKFKCKSCGEIHDKLTC